MFFDFNMPISFHCFIFLLILTGSIALGYCRTFHFHLCFSALQVIMIHIVFLLWTAMLMLPWMFSASFHFQLTIPFRISVFIPCNNN